MWVRRSLAVALAVAFVSGFGGSSTYSAAEVAKALRSHGFGTEVRTKDEWELLQTFPQPLPKGVTDVITTQERVPTAPGNQLTLVLEALIFDTQDNASCGGPKVLGTCLRKRNVAVFVRNRRAKPAREALADLD